MPDKRYRRISAIAVMASGVFGFSNVATSGGTVDVRWYTEEQVEQGQRLYLTHCATCHGQSAEATPEWRKTDANGNYPPPPLNGSAHAWHHPLSILKRSVAMGGVPYGGTMPRFAETLSEEEIDVIIAFFQNFWSDDIYARWLEIDSR